MRRIQPLVVWVSSSLSRALVIASAVIASGATPGLAGCGSGPTEAAKAPEAAQVAWKRGEGDDADSESDGPTTDRDAPTKSGEIDLDALEEDSAKAKAAQANAKSAAALAPAKAKEKKVAKVEEPPPAAEPPAAPEVEEPVAESSAAPEVTAAVPLGKEMRAAVQGNEKAPPPKKPSPKKKPAAAAAAPAYAGANPCTTADFKLPRVQQACANGGRTAAKSVMKEAIGKALAAGASLKCSTCHAEQQNFTLKKDAVSELKKWLGP